ncbi:hypothetical protein SmJEL517_g01917 [Synchytrium microbalum]|uniref:Ribosomal L1 domain-containing protein 1 n=1 Tax=Synchytrium microbalum TaxID=1806994 RepID=A0A507C842_9FUNG|nr:uncharacterized protein SmJEL517_g01917 [Synchytrium microbalum]TPX35782.1 hypothetical protein SmJEL517_g01917 [Synchytrium microbalum]
MDKKQVAKASTALLAHIEKQAASEENPNKNNLLDDGHIVWLMITTKLVPHQKTLKPTRIPLKHPLLPESAEICLITKDPQREFKDLLAKEGVKVSKVIGISKVKARYKPYEAKRMLATTYDLFLADDRILPLLPPILGKAFYGKKRQPVPVDLTRNVAKEIEKARTSTYLHLTRGTCSAIKIGTTNHTASQITENIMHAIPSIIAKIPNQWSNIQSINLKTSESIALPLYNALPDMQGIDEETVVAKLAREEAARKAEIDAEPTEEDKADLESLMKILFPQKKKRTSTASVDAANKSKKRVKREEAAAAAAAKKSGEVRKIAVGGVKKPADGKPVKVKKSGGRKSGEGADVKL